MDLRQDYPPIIELKDFCLLSLYTNSLHCSEDISFVNRFAFLLLTLTAGCLGDQLDLSEWMRSGRQLGDSDGVALGLVSALQKWANSLETKMVGLKDSNLQLVEVRSVWSK